MSNLDWQSSLRSAAEWEQGAGTMLTSPQHNWALRRGPQVRFACPSITGPGGDTEPLQPQAGDNAPRQPALHQGRQAGLGGERCQYICAAYRYRAPSQGQQEISATYSIVKIQRYLLTKAKESEIFCVSNKVQSFQPVFLESRFFSKTIFVYGSY